MRAEDKTRTKDVDRADRRDFVRICEKL